MTFIMTLVPAKLNEYNHAEETTRRKRDGPQLLKASAADALLTGRVRMGGPQH